MPLVLRGLCKVPMGQGLHALQGADWHREGQGGDSVLVSWDSVTGDWLKNTAHRAGSQLPFPSRFCLLGEKCGPFRSGQDTSSSQLYPLLSFLPPTVVEPCSALGDKGHLQYFPKAAGHVTKRTLA